MVALDFITAHVAQQFELGTGFNALGDDVHAQGVTEGDHGCRNCPVVLVVLQIAHEGLVDLQAVDGEAFEVGKAGIAGAKVIHGDPDATCLELAQYIEDVLHVIGQQAFGDFDFQLMALHAVKGEGLVDDADKIATSELPCGNIDADAQRRQAIGLPGFDLAAGFANDPVADGFDQATLFRHGDELSGGDEAHFRLRPANQRFGADWNGTVDQKLGLIEEDELAHLHRPA